MVKERIETVLGAIDAEDLGITLTHEHVTMDCSYCAIPPSNDKDRMKLNEPITLKNLNWLQHNPYSCLANIKLSPEKDAVVEDLKVLKKAGGSTIVENTSIGINRDVGSMVEISKVTGVHVVCGTGYFVKKTFPGEMMTATVEKMTETIVADITTGIDKTKVKPGIIGEVGCTWPLAEVEKRSLRASAIAQSQTETPVMLHPGKDPAAPFEIIRIFQEAGGDAKRAVIAHLDRTIAQNETLTELAGMGVFLEYDFFGSEVSYYPPTPTYVQITDAQRIDKIKHLISEGYSDKILVSHDVHACHQLTKYGGHGYSHILDQAVPKMRIKGISQEDIDKILVSNPKAWLTYY